MNFRRALAQFFRERRRLVHFRSIFEGYPIAMHRERAADCLIYEVNGLPSIERKYHHPDVADDRELLTKLRHQEDVCLAAADRIGGVDMSLPLERLDDTARRWQTASSRADAHADARAVREIRRDQAACGHGCGRGRARRVRRWRVRRRRVRRRQRRRRRRDRRGRFGPTQLRVPRLRQGMQGQHGQAARGHQGLRFRRRGRPFGGAGRLRRVRDPWLRRARA